MSEVKRILDAWSWPYESVVIMVCVMCCAKTADAGDTEGSLRVVVLKVFEASVDA